MKHHCPNCQRQYAAELKFCPKCGEANNKSAAKNFAKEQADNHEAMGGLPASNVTSHMDNFFPSNPRQVELSPNEESGAHREETRHWQEMVKEPDAAADHSANKPEQLPSPDPSISDPPYYRSIRMLSKTVIVSNVLTTLGIIGLALIFMFSQQRTQERLVTLTERFVSTNETLRAEVGQLKAGLQNLDAENAVLEEANKKLEQANETLAKANAETEVNLRQVKAQFAEQRMAALTTQQRKRAISTAVNNLASISAKTKNKTVKRTLEELARNSRSQEDPVKLYKEIARKLPNLDERTRAEIRDEVLDPLLGD